MPRPAIEDAADRLLAAGLQLFARRGVERVNTNAIARRAQLGIGTFYGHFADKYALLREIQLRSLAGLQSARAAAARAAGSDPYEQVDAVAAAAVDFAAAHPAAYRVTFGRERASAGPGGPVVSDSARPIARSLASLQAEGLVARDLDVELAARAYLAMETGTLLWWLEDPARASREAIVATLARLHPARCER